MQTRRKRCIKITIKSFSSPFPFNDWYLGKFTFRGRITLNFTAWNCFAENGISSVLNNTKNSPGNFFANVTLEHITYRIEISSSTKKLVILPCIVLVTIVQSTSVSDST